MAEREQDHARIEDPQRAGAELIFWGTAEAFRLKDAYLRGFEEGKKQMKKALRDLLL